jgi:hypothetical protein
MIFRWEKFTESNNTNKQKLIWDIEDIFYDMNEDVIIDISFANKTWFKDTANLIRLSFYPKKGAFSTHEYIDLFDHLNSFLEDKGYFYFSNGTIYTNYEKRRKSLESDNKLSLMSIHYLESKIKESVSFDPEDILTELTWDLVDAGLYVTLPKDNKFDGKFYLSISDTDKRFCKEYPRNDMDWLYNKPIMLDFYKEIEDFGLKRDKDFKIYGGGLGVNLVFDNKEVVKL